MCDGSAIAELERIAGKPTEAFDRGGKKIFLAPQTWKEIVPALPPICTEALNITTLGGVVDYLKANRDRLNLATLIIRATRDSVAVIGPLDEFRRREKLVESTAPAHSFRFERFLPLDEFSIGLQTQFVQTPARDALLAFCSTVTEERARISEDDGISQQVTTRKGVTLKATDRVPSPVALAPFRTFREVEQPVSPFVVRVKSSDDGPLFALFQADGAAWEVETTERIAAWLFISLESFETPIPVVR